MGEQIAKVKGRAMARAPTRGNRVAVALLHQQGKEEERAEVREVRARAQHHGHHEISPSKVVGRDQRIRRVRAAGR